MKLSSDLKGLYAGMAGVWFGGFLVGFGVGLYVGKYLI